MSLTNNTENWETDEIDLNLRHYTGHPTDVIKRIKKEIEQFLSTKKTIDNQVRIYSAIYNALEYYTTVSYIQPVDFDTEDSFLSCAIESFNQDFEYLSKEFNSKIPNSEPVITISARIKSPISFMEKVKEKINVYIKEGRDLKYFNESLRDIMGAKVIINPPDYIKKAGPQAESDFLHEVCYAWMSRHGIDFPESEKATSGTYRFLNVNTRYTQDKAEKVKKTGIREYSPELSFTEQDVFIPKTRIPIFERPEIDRVVKDYDYYTKPTGYQALHICVVPDYSDYLEESMLPICIIPPASNDYYIEFQFKTEKQNEFSEHGGASHRHVYKPHEIKYHRLAVPSYIEVDGPHDIADNFRSSYPSLQKKVPAKPKRLKLRNFAESFVRFYGYTFEERFGISFKDFRDAFNTKDRDDILALRKKAVFDPDRDTYHAEPVPIYVPITEDQKQSIIEKLSDPEDEAMEKVLDELGLIDSSKAKDDDVVFRIRPKIKFIPVKSPNLNHKVKTYRLLKQSHKSIMIPGNLNSKNDQPSEEQSLDEK